MGQDQVESSPARQAINEMIEAGLLGDGGVNCRQ
jgi:hypothetical protein